LSEDQEKGGEWLFRLKGNQPELQAGVALLFEDPVSPPAIVRQRSRHGDRLEVRELAVSSDLNEWAQWPHLAQVCRLIYTCRRKGKISRETSYIITSLSSQQATPAQLLALARGHWSIENRLHWVRDVTFDEDRCQIRTGAAPQVMAALRNLIIGLFRLGKARNIAAALRALAGNPRGALTLVTSNNAPFRGIMK
jgi:predicted transposase YbfD/YdcC